MHRCSFELARLVKKKSIISSKRIHCTEIFETYSGSKYQQALDAFGKALELAQSSLVLTIHAMIFAVYTNQNKPKKVYSYKRKFQK
jgi:hypothetical protein